MIKDVWYKGDLCEQRYYDNYQEYLSHQADKLIQHPRQIEMIDGDVQEFVWMRIKDLTYIKRGMNVLCLGARLGGEVKAFIKKGCFALGIDINPGKENKYVLHGDFHSLKFSDNSIDVIYTNSLDHVFDLEKVVTEISRVLKPGGIFITELVNCKKKTNQYESMFWQSPSIVIDYIEKFNFLLMTEKSINIPWPGKCAIFRNRTDEEKNLLGL